MNRIIFSEKNRKVDENDLFETTDPDVLFHLNRILGTNSAKSQNIVKATLIGKGTGQAELLERNENKALFKFSHLSESPKPWFNLIIGLSRPPTLKKILEHATAFGAKSMYFFKAELSEKSYLQSKIWEEGNLSKTLKLGISQGGNYSHLPEVTLSPKLPESLIQDLPHKLLLDLKSNQWMDKPQVDQTEPITFIIGPERGWTEKERETIIGLGATPIKTSSSILRTEMATFSILAQAELLRSSF
jgi:16S rRNA (uracil1498-N3)-methyltransferase